MLNSKKASDKILSVYWFAILVIVAGGISIMVLNFSQPYDVRGVEANLLIDSVADCTSGEKLIILDNKFESECHLNFESREDEEQYFVELNYYDYNSNVLLKSVSAGNVNLKDKIALSKKSSIISSFKSLYDFDDEREYRIDINVYIGKGDENAK